MSAKIKTIKIQNFKAISEFEADFNGCTAIIMAGNNKGKTSLLRGIPDRIRFVRPDVMVKEGATQGKGEMTLTTGEKFIWEFDSKGKDKLTYVSSENIKQNLTKEIGGKFFPPMFDIDKFLQSGPKEQAKQLQQIVGVDFTDVDARYTAAYNERTARNAESEKYHVKLSAMLKVDPLQSIDLTALQSKKELLRGELNKKYLENVQINKDTRKKWDDAKSLIDNDVNTFNDTQKNIQNNYDTCKNAFQILLNFGYNKELANEWLLAEFINVIKPIKKATDLYPPEPTYIPEMPDDKEMRTIDAQIFEASETNEKARQYTEYVNYKASTEQAKTLADAADIKVKEIEAERNKMIASAKFPQGISITNEGILVDGFPLDRNQISTSKLYCTSLRIASMNLGEVKTLYFDASFLDRNSLAEIEVWANENDLQLLIERPDFEGGEIKYELIENEVTTIPVEAPKTDLFAA